MKQKERIEKRVLEISQFFVDSKSTVRETAKKFCMSKSTVYTDLTKHLPCYDTILAIEVRKILDKNLCERSFRGGAATKQKFLLLKNEQKKVFN